MRRIAFMSDLKNYFVLSCWYILIQLTRGCDNSFKWIKRKSATYPTFKNPELCTLMKLNRYQPNIKSVEP